MADNKDVKRGIVLYLDGKEVKNNAVSIQAEMRKVKKEINNCTIGSEEYVAATQKYQQLNAILAEHKNKLKGINDQLKDNKVKAVEAQGATKNWLKWGIDKFNAYSVAILGAVAALTGVTMKLMAFKKLGSEKQESQANLKALTGLDDDSIAWLTQQAEILSTTMEKSGLRVRKSSREILDAYMLVGSAKPELLQDKEALNAVTIEAMRLAEAAKMNLKDAVDGVTLALNQYGDGADQAARYVNVLAAGSKAGAAGVEAQTVSIIKSGVAASVAKVPIEQLVGSIETLAEKGIKGEIAGTGLKTFFLKLEGGAKDCRPSVVGLQQALENLQAKNMSATEMQKMFGLEAYTVAQAMISGAASVKKYTEAVTDTNVATEQAAINSETDAAKLAQLKNKMNETGIILAKRLAPAFSMFTNWTSKFVQTMPAMLDFLQEYGIYILELAATYAVLSLRVKAVTAVQDAYHKVLTIGKGIQTTYTTVMVHMRLAMSGCTTAQIGMTRAIVSSNAIQRTAIAVSSLFRAAMLALTGQTAAATVALKAFRIAMAFVNPWTIAIAAIGAATIAMTAYFKAQNKVEEKHKALNALKEKVAEKYDEESAHIEVLNNRVHDNSLKIDERREALKELKGIVEDYKGDLTDEGKLINDNTTAIDNYLKSLEKRIRLQAAQEDLESKIKEKRKKERELSKQKETAKSSEQNMVNNANNYYGPGTGGAVLGYAIVATVDKNSVKKTEKEIEDLNDDIKDLYKEVNDASGLNTTTTTTTKTGSDDSDGDDGNNDSSEEARKKRVKKALEAIETESNHKLAELKQQYIDGEIKSEEEYSQKAEQIELERMKKSLEVAGLEPAEREKLVSKVQDIYFNAKKELLDWQEQEESAKNRSYENQFEELEKAKGKEKYVIEHAHDLGLLSEEYYQKALLTLDEKYNKKREEAYAKSEERKRLLKQLAESTYNTQKFDDNLKDNTGSDFKFLAYYKNLRTEIENAREQLADMDPESDEYKVVEEYMDGLISIYNEKGKILTDMMADIGTSLGESLGNAISGQEVTLKSALKGLLLVLIDAVEKMIEATMVVPTLKALTGVGAGKALADLAKLVAVKAAFSALKAAARGWESGGYTGVGAHDEPAGIVHRGEFVANRFALANPAIKSVLDLIDGAQRSGSVQNLSSEEISAAAGGRTQSPSAPSAESTPTNVIVNSPENTDLIELLQTLKERFDKPIVAETYATGKGGTMEAERLVTQMENNASRR